jgi:hypothetical protein
VWSKQVQQNNIACHNYNTVTTTTVTTTSVTTTTLSQLQHCHNYNSHNYKCHNYNTVTTTTVSQLQHCHNYNTVTTTTLSQLQHCHKSNFVIFQEKLLNVLKCYNFLWVQRRLNCSPAASFANRVMTLYLLKVNLQTFLSIPISQKCQILSCDTLVANERYN